MTLTTAYHIISMHAKEEVDKKLYRPNRRVVIVSAPQSTSELFSSLWCYSKARKGGVILSGDVVFLAKEAQ